MPDVVTPTPDLPEFPPPPSVLGLSWTKSTMMRTRRGPRRLSKANATDAFDAAWRWGESGLRGHGFDREDARVIHWGGERRRRPDHAEAADKLDSEHEYFEMHGLC